MSTSSPARWTVPGASFAVWALAAASAVYWGLKLSASAAGIGIPTIPPQAPLTADPAAIARLLGSSPMVDVAAAPQAQAPALASRLALAGVVAGRSRAGVALIAVDGRPAKPFRVGAVVVDDVVLQSVERRRAVLAGKGQPAVTLELPAPASSSVSAAPPPMMATPGPVPGQAFPPGVPVIPAPGSAPGLAVSPGAVVSPGLPRPMPGGAGVQPGPVPMAAPR
jgi:general secretion pathway protein C